MNPETDPVQAHPGLNMQEFTRGEELCQGPSGAVVLAQHTSGTPVVLKVMPVVLNPNQQQQVLSQLNMLYNSDHPSICRFYGCTYSEQGDAGSCLYLGLEYCEVRSLDDIYRNPAFQRIPEDVLGVIAGHVLSGLAYLHRTRYQIHRDIKPSNILIKLNGEVKITDFGLSGQLVNTLDKKRTYVGAVTYMSPERISGLSYAWKSDIWSLGITLAECAQGQYPYHAQNPNQELYDLLDVIVDQPAPTLPAGQFSAEFQDFIANCLRKQDESRLSAEDLLNHPFVTMHRGKDISQWAATVYAQQQQQRAAPVPRT